METVVDRVHDVHLGFWPAVDHVLLGEWHAEQTPLGRDASASSVLDIVVVTGVMLPAVDLDHQPIPHQEIDMTQTGDVGLNRHVQTLAAQAQPRHRLRARRGPLVSPTQTIADRLGCIGEHLL